MMRRIVFTSLLASAAAGCATTQSADGSSAPKTKEERMRISNQSPFDVSVCQMKPPALPQPSTQGGLVGGVLFARPQIMECLADPKTRGPADTTRIVVKTSVNEQGGTHAVSGENLTPEGIACVQKTVDAQVPLTALTKGSEPLESESVFEHEAGNSPSVKFGLNAGSDYSGTVRLAQPQWCECYAPFANQAPPTLMSKITLKKGAATAADITFEPVGTPEGEALAACLKGKMAAVPAKLDVDELKFPYRFIHFNSRATEPAADLQPEMRFFQLDLVRNQRSAEVAIAHGYRANAAEAYDEAVARYQKTKDWKLVDELKSKCKVLVETSQAKVKSIEAQLEVDKSTLGLAQELKAKDASWADLEPRAQEVIKNTEQELTAAQERYTNDQAACPKETKEAAPKKDPKKK